MNELPISPSPEPSAPPALEGEAPVEALPIPSTLSLSPELKAGHECVPGQEYLVTIRATAQEDGSFDVSALDSLQPSTPEGAVEETPEGESSSPEEIKALGYDRSKLMKRPKPAAPKMSAKDLEY